MPWIDFSRYGSVADYIKAHQHADSKMCLLDPFPQAIVQHGQTCKIYALSVVMEWMHNKYPEVLPAPPPARKRDRINTDVPGSFVGRSLRQQAKEDFGSVVGEIYDYNTVLKLAKQNGIENARAIDSSGEEYVANIKNEIDKGNAPIIYFDVSDDSRGMPVRVKSAREHSAVLAGYFTHVRNKELYFILLQWGEYYTVNANKLAESANQLSIGREPEYFYKKDKDWKDGSWASVFLKRMAYRTAVAHGPVSTDGNFRNKIIILDAPKPELRFNK